MSNVWAMIKRLSPILVAVFGVSVGFSQTFTDGDWTYILNQGGEATATITAYSGAGGQVAIPSSVNGYPVEAVGSGSEPVFGWENSSLTNVIIPDSVTSIEKKAFNGALALISVTIGNSVKNIGAFAFEDCISLPDVFIPESVTSIGEEAFKDCSSLTSIEVAALNQDYSSIEGVLFDKHAEKLITFPAGKSGEYVVPDGVETIGHQAFHFCEGLTSVTLPNSLRTIEEAAFYECSALVSVNLGVGLQSVESWAFAFCTSLTNITIPASVTSIGQAVFQQCVSLPRIDVAPLNPAYASIDGVLFDVNAEALIAFPAGRPGAYAIPDNVETIAAGAFHGCLDLTAVTIPDSVISIGGYAFRDCVSLTSVTIPDSVTSIGGYAFRDCVSLASVTIGNGVTSVGERAFRGCNLLRSLYFLGDAPIAGTGIFDRIDSVGAVYYVAGSTGWEPDFATWPTQELPIGPLLDSFGESQFEKGKSSVTSNPSAFDLFTQTEYDNNRMAGRSDVINDPSSYNLYTSDSIMDLRMDGLMVQRQGSNAVVIFQPQTTMDLATQPFTNNGTAITNVIPMPGNKGFLRIEARP